MLIKLFTLYVYLQTALCGCGADRRNSDFERLRKDYKVKVQRIGRLDSRIKESSGLAHASDSTLWTHPDSGSPAELYLFNLKGELLRTVPLPLPNRDWEELAQDRKGNLYIGDFGNNANARRDLRVFRVQQEGMAVQDTIYFSFADQQEFPPPTQQRHFDMEAFFYRADSLHLFTKSRARKGITHRYTLPALGGTYTLEPQEKIRVSSAITAADSAPNGKDFALLGYGRLYLFEPQDEQVQFAGKRYCLPLGRTGQAEALLYLSPTELLISNENGKLYLVSFEPKH
ncbi:hypothetical protein [Pontibacter sp. BAB1700]|uniref:hypothetical protein n=1 Tax=Pontibacter sp. BAB1700 TaxID=1144253 RepID=UPI00026BE16A|nr:hypothetical protein [Pontibacter sp. BAB1700]EJF08361.1 hypothetical protein O71_21262 [Pontibacter sp. BAB1700]